MSKEARAYASTVLPRTRCAATNLQVSMLFHITQTHTPQTCPLGEGGSDTLFNADEPGVRLLGRYGANSEHTMIHVVVADDWQALHRFLLPGFKRNVHGDPGQRRGRAALALGVPAV